MTSIKFAFITDTGERHTIESVTNVGIRLAERRSLEMIIETSMKEKPTNKLLNTITGFTNTSCLSKLEKLAPRMDGS